MVKKEYAHLVKPMLVQKGPPGLYPEPRIWMEGKDLEGFNANFSFGFIKEPTVLHPVKGSIVHPYDECLIFEGTDTSDILKLHAEIAVRIGEEQEEYTFDQPSVVLIPRGTPHGPVTVRRVDNPIVHYHIGLAADYKASAVPLDKSLSVQGSKYKHLIKRMVTSPPPEVPGGAAEGYETARYKSVIDARGVMRPAEAGVGPGNGDQIVWLYGR
ncbi:MAG: hypothetical protein NUV31_11660, partial [Dehalococcoidales bacterium]|nr:hypothetical protein [Dehalococcoidales bacterium]